MFNRGFGFGAQQQQQQQPQQQQVGFGGFGGQQQQAPQQQAAPAFGGGGFGGFGGQQQQAAPAPSFAGGFGAQAGIAGMAPAAAGASGSQLEIPMTRAGADTIQHISWAPTTAQDLIASAHWDNKVTVWSIGRAPTGAPTSSSGVGEQDFGAPVMETVWQSDSTGLFAGGCNKKLQHWNLATNTVQDVGTHDAPIKSVSMLHNHNLVVTGGWDRAIKVWDLRSPTAAHVINLPERVYAMDAYQNYIVTAAADKKIYMYDITTGSMRELASPLKHQPRALRIFRSAPDFYAVSSIEGRCAIRCINQAQDELTENGKAKYSFAFKCHRDKDQVFAVNSLDTFPAVDNSLSAVFSTAGSDGMVSFWHKDDRRRLKEFKPFGGRPITATAWNPRGDLFAYAGGYDWSKGIEYHKPATDPTQLVLHHHGAGFADLRT